MRIIDFIQNNLEFHTLCEILATDGLFLEFHTLCEIKENRGARPKFHTCVKLSGSQFSSFKLGRDKLGRDKFGRDKGGTHDRPRLLTF